jgi:hypothetical protein
MLLILSIIIGIGSVAAGLVIGKFLGINEPDEL